jgi:hypothetical protein
MDSLFVLVILEHLRFTRKMSIKARKPRNRAKTPRRPLPEDVPRALLQVNLDEAWLLLVAAAASPAARHRWPSVGAAAGEVLRAMDAQTKQGTQSVALQDLVDDAARRAGIGASVEDFIASDPTNTVLLRVGNESRHIFPGITERPISDIHRAERLALCVDHVLTKKIGFGIRNMLDVCTRYENRCIMLMKDVWEPKPDLEQSDDIILSDREIAMASQLAGISSSNLVKNSADTRALNWMTAPASSALYTLGGTSGFGHTLRFRSDNGKLPYRLIPVAFVPEIVEDAAAALVELVIDEPGVRSSILDMTATKTREHLARLGNAVVGSSPLHKFDTEADPSSIQWLVPQSEQLVLAIQVLSKTERQTSAEDQLRLAALRRIGKRSKRPSSTRVSLLGGGSVTLSPDTEIIPILIVSSTHHVAIPQVPEYVSMSLDDLDWITRTADSASDLISFSRDMLGPDMPKSFGWEAVDYWEPWRTNGKSFFTGGIGFGAAYFAPHAGEAEWDLYSALGDLETVLLKTGLPSLRHASHAESGADMYRLVYAATDAVYDSVTGEYEIMRPSAWVIPALEPPVAISVSHDAWRGGQEFTLLSDLGVGLSYGMLAAAVEWQRANSDLDAPTGYQLRLWAASAEGETVQHALVASRFEHVKETDHSESLVVGHWTIKPQEFADAVNGRPEGANINTAGAVYDLVVAAGAADEMAEELKRAWLAAPPFLVIEIQQPRTHRVHLPHAITFDDAKQSKMIRVLGMRLAREKVMPGVYRGHSANLLVREHLAPAALEELKARVSVISSESLVDFGLEQLARVAHERQRNVSDLQRVAKHFNTSWNPIDRMAELSATLLRLRQANETLIEMALIQEDATTSAMAHLSGDSWTTLLAAADSYLSIAQYSERLHYQVASVQLEISETYEMAFAMDATDEAGDWPILLRQLNFAAAEEVMVASGDKSVSTPEVLGAFDVALEDAYGVRREDVYMVLVALVQWAEFVGQGSVSKVPLGHLYEYLYSAFDTDDDDVRRRIRAVVQLLSSTAAVMRGDTWQPWRTRTRRHRLLIEPLVSSNGVVRFTPHFVEVTLSVYYAYFSQGVLPWSEVPTRALERALNDVRQARNREFEESLVSKLTELGFIVISRVKPGDGNRLGVPTITTEIDLIVGRVGGSDIWLVEAKDPASVHGIAETARQLRAFFRDTVSSRGKSAPSYATQLARKHSELTNYLPEIARSLGLKGSARAPWRLRTAFVTRNVTPAGYVKERYPVLSLEQFLWAVKSEGVALDDLG